MRARLLSLLRWLLRLLLLKLLHSVLRCRLTEIVVVATLSEMPRLRDTDSPPYHVMERLMLRLRLLRLSMTVRLRRLRLPIRLLLLRLSVGLLLNNLLHMDENRIAFIFEFLFVCENWESLNLNESELFC